VSEPSGRGHTTTERGGTPIGRRARLPTGAREPIRVFINGVEQKRGVDYELEPGGIRFTEPISKEGEIRGLRRLTLLLGLVGVYRKHEVVDVEYTLGAETKFASDLEIIPDPPGSN
jgi:hypothetical protein